VYTLEKKHPGGGSHKEVGDNNNWPREGAPRPHNPTTPLNAHPARHRGGDKQHE